MRTIWNGSISFGLVNIPIGLALASQSTLTPNGTFTDGRSSPITAAIAVGISGPTAS